jgi:ferritin-like metal-binding protein YciE
LVKESVSENTRASGCAGGEVRCTNHMKFLKATNTRFCQDAQDRENRSNPFLNFTDRNRPSIPLAAANRSGPVLPTSNKRAKMVSKVKTLQELFEIEMRYAYDCEQKLIKKGLPSMIESASSPELRSALQQHLQETRGYAVRLERVFGALGAEPGTEDNEVVDEFLDAAKDSVSNIDDSPLRDAALIVTGNIIEHYEIGVCGTLAAFARNLGLQDVVPLLEDTLKEEKAADGKLTQNRQNGDEPARRSSSGCVVIRFPSPSIYL